MREPGQDSECHICGHALRWIEQPFPKLSDWEVCPMHAAAPDLLAALEALTQGYQYLSNAPPSQKELWDNAFAAVAKAKGIKE